MRQHTSEANIAGASLTLADYTSPGLVISSLRAQDAAAVIQELSAALQREGRVSDLLPFYHSALNREFLCSTATEPGWALPHALVKGLETACFALGRSTAPMVWMAKDKQRAISFFTRGPGNGCAGVHDRHFGPDSIEQGRALDGGTP